MELRTYLNLIRRRLALIIVTMIVGGAVAYTVSNTEPVYAAESTIYVGSNTFTVDDPLSLSGDRTAAIAGLTRTFAAMIDSKPIAQAALELAGASGEADDVVQDLAAEVEFNTNLIRITFTDPDPEIARTIANAVADAFAEGIQDFEQPGEPEVGDLPALPAYVFERADLPETPVPTTQLRNTVLGAMFGLLLAVGLVLLLDYVDVTAKSADDVETRLELPVLGMIPESRVLAQSRETVVTRG